MSTYRVPKCGRHFVKFDDVNIYPVLVVARIVKTHTRTRKNNFTLVTLPSFSISSVIGSLR